MEYPKRKPTRIPGYDYSKQNYYFVTFCTDNKSCLFWQENQLNDLGMIAENCLLNISKIYSGIRIEKYAVMPNHIHAVIVNEGGISITQIVGQYKRAVTKEIHRVRPDIKVWQRSFHDHIIRDQADFERIWCYIHGNPQKWSEDCFYTTEEI